jgi:hypothetical protein
MSTETAEPDAGRCRCPDRCSGNGGNDDLPSVGRRADASSGVNGQTDVPNIGECWAAAMDPDTDPHLKTVGQTVDPGPVAELAPDRHCRLNSGCGPLEDCKELVGARVDLAAARSQQCCPQDASDVVQ